MRKKVTIDINNAYERHEDLSVAKRTCYGDSKCIGIYEASCDINGTFFLVENSFVTSAYGTSCIHKKKEYGNLFYVVS